MSYENAQKCQHCGVPTGRADSCHKASCPHAQKCQHCRARIDEADPCHLASCPLAQWCSSCGVRIGLGRYTCHLARCKGHQEHAIEPPSSPACIADLEKELREVNASAQMVALFKRISIEFVQGNRAKLLAIMKQFKATHTELWTREVALAFGALLRKERESARARAR